MSSRRFQGFVAALAFLTPVPLPSAWQQDATAIERSLPYFPLVGVLIGGYALAVDTLSLALFGAPLLASALTVLALIAASKALHLDGLSDTFDGFLSSRSKERMLEIMRDSRVGTMGALAMVGVVLTAWAALASLSGGARVACVFLMPLAGRCGLVFHMVQLPYARTEGLASSFKLGVRGRDAVLAALGFALAGFMAAGWVGVAVAAVTLVASAGFARYCASQIDGFTGDTLGASCELMQLVPSLVLLALRDMNSPSGFAMLRAWF